MTNNLNVNSFDQTRPNNGTSKLLCILLLTVCSFNARSIFAQAPHWSQTNGPELSGANILGIGPTGELYAAATNRLQGIYKSKDNGLTWIYCACVLPTGIGGGELGAHDFMITRNNTLLIENARFPTAYARSTDDGVSWTTFPLPSFPIRTRFRQSLCTFPNGDLLLYDSLFSRSTDDGISWHPLPHQPMITSGRDGFVLAVGITGNGTITYASQHGSDSINFSTDGGNSWNNSYSATQDQGSAVGYFTNDGDTAFYSLRYSDWGPSLFHLNPTAMTFDVVSPLPWFYSGHYPVQDSFYIAKWHNVLYILTDSALCRSTDNGLTLKVIPLPRAQPGFGSLSVDSSGNVYVGGDAGLWVTSDDVHWRRLHIYSSKVSSIEVSKDGSVLALSTWDFYTANGLLSRTQLSHDGGGSWTDLGIAHILVSDSYPTDSGFYTCLGIDRSGQFIIGDSDVSKGHTFYRRTSDNGQSWFKTGKTPGGLACVVQNAIDSTFYGGTPHVISSNDNGSSWDELSDGITNAVIHALTITPNGNIFAASDGTIYRNQQGPSWNKLQTQLHGSSVFALASDSNGTVYAGTEFEGVIRSTDNGDSWVVIKDGLPTDSSVDQLIVLPNKQIFAALSGGLYYLDPGKSKWQNGSEGILDHTVLSVAFRDTLCYIGTAHNGVFRTAIAKITGSVVATKADDAVILTQNFPNPCSAMTSFAYDIPVSAEITITITDVLGTVRSSFVVGRKSAGEHTFGFDTGMLSNGVYFYTMKGAGTSASIPTRLTRSFTVAK